MERKKNDIFKKLIQKVEVDRPTISFTEAVLNEVRVEAGQEVVINAGLMSLLTRLAVEKPYFCCPYMPGARRYLF
jgi:hypothetical protein